MHVPTIQAVLREAATPLLTPQEHKTTAHGTKPGSDTMMKDAHGITAQTATIQTGTMAMETAADKQ